KSVNDRFGHDAGDRVIARIARLLEDAAGEESLVARWGGEEFAILLSDTGHQSAVRVAERLRRQIEKLNIQFNDNQIHLEASIGVIACRKREPLEQAMQRVDLCLRQAKAEGRNRITVYPEDMPAQTEAMSVA
ncbi:MAG: GGDEF domain-containing protein, partial [Pseudomonadota bacterium]|nr:GGDEF domain-containing protein [Pseudomonadota bacterium]